MLCKTLNTMWAMKILVLAAGTLALPLVLGLAPEEHNPAPLPLPRGEASPDSPAQVESFRFKRIPARPRAIPELTLAHHVYEGPTVALTSLVLESARKRIEEPKQPRIAGLSPKIQRLRRADKLPNVQQAVVDVMMKNTAAKAQDRKAAGKERKHPAEQAARAALAEMCGGKKIVLRKVQDPLTGNLVLDKLVAEEARILGVGGTAVVLALAIKGEKEAAALGTNELALKVMYHQFKESNPTQQHVRFITNEMELMLGSEIEPMKAMARMTSGGSAAVTARDVARGNRLVLPLYEAVMGCSDDIMHIHDNVGFFNKVILSEVMMGDGADLLHESEFGNAVGRLPVSAREFVCSQVIDATAKLHAARICHADIKPENFLIAKDGTVHLTDFGMAGTVGERRPCADKITTLYMDPTHAACMDRRGHSQLTEKYDAWSLGMTCYIILTNGRLPYNIFIGDGVERHLASIDKTYSSRALALEGPEKSLLQVGVSKFWTEIVSSLLNRDRSRRPTPKELVAKYPKWPQSNEDL